MDKLNKKVWFLVEVLESKDNTSVVKSELFDKTEIRFKVPTWLIDPLKDRENFGWIEVDCHGELNGRVSISLPHPVLEMGHDVSVSSKRINRQKRTNG